jgi:hypothetical protein
VTDGGLPGSGPEAPADPPRSGEAGSDSAVPSQLSLLLSLRAWVDWLVAAYALFDEWPECWYRHMGAVNELLALQRWHASALIEEPPGSQLALWHDGLARVRERAIRPLLQSCHATGHVDPSADQAGRWLELRERMAATADAYWAEQLSGRSSVDVHRDEMGGAHEDHASELG